MCHVCALSYQMFLPNFVFSFHLKTRLEMQKALEEDSSVYDYDAVYDEIQKQRLEANKKVLGGTDKRVTSHICSFVFLFLDYVGWKMKVQFKQRHT